MIENLLVYNVCNRIIPGTKHLLGEHIELRVLDLSSAIMIFLGNHSIRQLETLEHTPEEIEHLNNVGLNIYLYEPICSYIVNEQVPAGMFYTEFLGTEDPNILRAYELDSIVIYVTKNHLKNVTVWTGDYNVEKSYPFYTEYIKLACNDIFLTTLTYFRELEELNKEKEISYKFISTNWRFTHNRMLMSALLTKFDSIIGWQFYVSTNVLRNCAWFHKKNVDPDFYEKVVAGIAELNVLDTTLDNPNSKILKTSIHHLNYPKSDKFGEGNPVVVNPIKLPLAAHYKKAFVDIVNESRFAQPTANISEKTFQAMQFKTPFVLLAPYQSLNYLHELGFETFGEWWDESYDYITDNYQRFKKIYSVIESINSWSYDDINVIYKEMQEVLDLNYNRMIEISRTGKFEESFGVISDEVQWT